MSMSPTQTASSSIAADSTLSNASGVSWAAIAAGALAASVLSLILLILGSGIGLSMVSPWSGAGAGLTAFSVSTAIWLIVTQWASAGVGGYLAGRLRTKWVGVHTDEVFFRDTAHGLLAWALASVVAVGILGSAVTGLIGTGTSGVASVAGRAVQGAASSSSALGSLSPDYFVDAMFRPAADAAASTQNDPANRQEASRIFVTSLTNGSLSPADKTELARLVAARTGMAQADAEKRVADVMAQVDAAKTKAKEAADAARKVAATTALMTALSLFIGAFIASVAAALGGKLRDAF